MSTVIKLSSPATHEYWEIPVLYEDAHLLALDKPPSMLVSPDPRDPERPSLMKLLHAAITKEVPWAKERGLSYLMNTHRLDFETSGVLLLAKDRPTLVAMANLFSSEKTENAYVAFVRGAPKLSAFTANAKLGPHPRKPGMMRVDSKHGKKSRTDFRVREAFKGYTLLECRPHISRTHQIRVHLFHARLHLLGDALYNGPKLRLSSLKSDYRLREGQTERPLVLTAALHAESLALKHPVTGADLRIEAPWPKDLRVALKYLRMYAALKKEPSPVPDRPIPDQAMQAENPSEPPVSTL